MTFDTRMEQHEHRILVYITLAEFSSRKQQPAGRDRFLILAGVAACESGWLDVAARCREFVLKNNPQHLIGRYESIPDGLRDTEFQPFLTQLERLCPMERAEHFLREWNLTPLNWPNDSDSTVGEFAMGMLADIDPSA
jgi:hypothetical protein